MKKILNLRVNGWIYLASVFLYAAIVFITALFSTLRIIGICYSGFTEITEDETRLAHYEYEVDGRTYSYTADIGSTSEFLVSSAGNGVLFQGIPLGTYRFNGTVRISFPDCRLRTCICADFPSRHRRADR